MAEKTDFWEQLQKDCHALAPEVGAATGAVYGFGADKIGGPLAGQVVEDFIAKFVTENWPHSCDLPSNLAAALDQQQSPAIDAPTQADDSSSSPDM